jgi:hypothetical protein
MGPDFLQSLKIITKFRVDTIGQDLGVLAVDNILLSVQEPCRDLELGGVLDDGDDTFQLVRVQLSSTIEENVLRLHAQPTFKRTHRLLRSTSAFLQTKLEYRRPTPLISVKANIIFRFPSTLVFSKRRICYTRWIGKLRDTPGLSTSYEPGTVGEPREQRETCWLLA